MTDQLTVSIRWYGGIPNQASASSAVISNSVRVSSKPSNVTTRLMTINNRDG